MQINVLYPLSTSNVLIRKRQIMPLDKEKLTWVATNLTNKSNLH